MKKRETKHPNRNRLGMQTTFKDSLWQKAIERSKCELLDGQFTFNQLSLY